MRASTSSARTDPGTVVDGGAVVEVLVVAVVVVGVVVVVDVVDVIDGSVVGSIVELDLVGLVVVGVAARIVRDGAGCGVAGAEVVTAAVSSSPVAGSTALAMMPMPRRATKAAPP
jgi:hypothetical protein